MRINDRITLEIESVAFGGSGVGRANGFVVFAPFTAPGDLVEVEIVERKKQFARGRLRNILRPSPSRTSPLCRYYEQCGGCSYQHIAYPHQLIIKQQQVAETFFRIGKIAELNMRDIIGSPSPYSYRGKAQLHAEKWTDGFQLGLMDISGCKLVDIERCEIMDETINNQLSKIRKKEWAVFNNDTVTLWSQYPDHFSGTIVRRVKGLEFLIPKNGFFQANLYLTDALVDAVCNLVHAKKRGTILDACCGSGLFSIFLASAASRTVGVEISEASVKYARLNAERLKAQNTEFIAGNVDEVLQNMAARKEVFDFALVDPPRTGLDPTALSALTGLHPEEIVYISCNPSTQARDIRYLKDHGYRLHSLLPLDMFPQTEHIETIAHLQCT
ncbi:MAG: class I SAM-dependent RNA methyltransferase [Syntrophaceae bacterium]|jgi:23S rRNA (uracil1939-C5)-methyltransferase|nr:class I SAM-dependent RNA methyltransferase [Syntrophaceae bacterium]